jgi:PadR family transcriptional regulator PadR
MLPCVASYLAVPRSAEGSFDLPEAIDIQLKKGALELCVLALLSQHDSYAYEIASRLAEAIGMGEGTIYPLMRRLQNDGLVDTYLVESPTGPPRKYYRLTEAGRTSFDTQKAAWDAFVRAMQNILGVAP